MRKLFQLAYLASRTNVGTELIGEIIIDNVCEIWYCNTISAYNDYSAIKLFYGYVSNSNGLVSCLFSLCCL